MKEYAKVITLTLFNLTVSVIVPLGLSFWKIIDNSTSAILGVEIMILLTSVQILFHATKLAEMKSHDLAIWTIRDKVDSSLHSVRESFRRIQSDSRYGSNDLFENFFMDAIKDLEQLIHQTAETGVLKLDREHLLSHKVLLESFQGKTADVFRPVHYVKDNDFLFAWGREYFHRINELVEKRRIKQVNRLIIYVSDEELKDPRTMRLAQFHQTVQGYDCRFIKLQDFKHLLQNHALDCPADFGIYGSYYVYRGRNNEVGNIIGDWLRSPKDIEAFIKLFDDCWNSAFAKKPSLSSKPITLTDLFID